MKYQVKDPIRKVSTGGYSAGILCDGWLYVSGQGPVDPATGRIVPGTIEEEVVLTLANVERILAAAGCTRQSVVKSTCHLADIRDFERFDQAYRKFFTGIRPARTTVESGLDGIKVEIDVVARVEGASRR